MLHNKGKNIEFIDTKRKLNLQMLEKDYPKEYNECIEDFKKHWESKGYFNGEKIGVFQRKENKIEYYHTDYQTMRFVYNFLRHRVDLPNDVLNSSLGIHIIIRDDVNYLITKRMNNAEGEQANNLYQLSTSEGVVFNDMVVSKEKNIDLIQYLIERSVEEELGIQLKEGEYKYIGYSEVDNRPFIVYEVGVENLRKLLEGRTESIDSLEGMVDILGWELVNEKALFDTKNKQLTDSYRMYLDYLNKSKSTFDLKKVRGGVMITNLNEYVIYATSSDKRIVCYVATQLSYTEFMTYLDILYSGAKGAHTFTREFDKGTFTLNSLDHSFRVINKDIDNAATHIYIDYRSITGIMTDGEREYTFIPYYFHPVFNMSHHFNYILHTLDRETFTSHIHTFLSNDKQQDHPVIKVFIDIVDDISNGSHVSSVLRLNEFVNLLTHDNSKGPRTLVNTSKHTMIAYRGNVYGRKHELVLVFKQLGGGDVLDVYITEFSKGGRTRTLTYSISFENYQQVQVYDKRFAYIQRVDKRPTGTNEALNRIKNANVGEEYVLNMAFYFKHQSRKYEEAGKLD